MDRDIIYQPVTPVNHGFVSSLPQYGQQQSDAEIIDLDSARDEIKQTTWHK